MTYFQYILGRPIRFHDLAFFDPVIYESLRQLVMDTEKSGSESSAALQALDLTFSIDLCAEEGGGSTELIANGRDVEVNSVNIYQYVRKYAEYRMVTSQEKALKKVCIYNISDYHKCNFYFPQIKEGVFDVIPSGSVDTLTSEDFRLLLNGVGDINVTTLISYTSFNDESGERLYQLCISNQDVTCDHCRRAQRASRHLQEVAVGGDREDEPSGEAGPGLLLDRCWRDASPVSWIIYLVS